MPSGLVHCCGPPATLFNSAGPDAAVSACTAAGASADRDGESGEAAGNNSAW